MTLGNICICLAKTHPKYLNSDACFNRAPSTDLTLQYLLPTQYLHLDLMCIDFQTSSSPTYVNKTFNHHLHTSSACKRLGNLHSLLSSGNFTHILPIPIFTYFITASVYTLKKSRLHDKTLSQITFNSETLALAPFHSINIHTLNLIQKFNTYIIHSQHLLYGLPINPIIHLLQINKTHIHPLRFTTCFLQNLL